MGAFCKPNPLLPKTAITINLKGRKHQKTFMESIPAGPSDLQPHDFTTVTHDDLPQPKSFTQTHLFNGLILRGGSTVIRILL